ncbi:MAG: PAS domain-containing protein [Candidatus Eisenbacteria bacterium]
MLEREQLLALLNSLADPILVADARHVVTFVNAAAVEHYSGGEALLGTSLLDCHNEASCRVMEDTLVTLERGEDEALISSDAKRRIYMRAVRDGAGALIGYYERYAPPERVTEE